MKVEKICQMKQIVCVAFLERKFLQLMWGRNFHFLITYLRTRILSVPEKEVVTSFMLYLSETDSSGGAGVTSGRKFTDHLIPFLPQVYVLWHERLLADLP